MVLNDRGAYPAVRKRRLVALPEIANPENFVGTCDWGGCNGEAWGMRWDKEFGRYLTVCEKCSRIN